MNINDKKESWKIFEKIALRYDLANRILSLGLDTMWRKRMAEFLPEKNELIHADIATGTADVIIALRQSSTKIIESIGIDKSPKILMLAEKKILKHHFFSTTLLKIGDGEKIPLKEKSCDVATLSFGIRNFASVEKGLSELSRILRKKGKAIILEFSTPKNRIIRAGYFFYLSTIVPVLGGIISGSFSSYRYLNQTIKQFPSGKDFTALMQSNGFTKVIAVPLLWGGVTIYVGEKA